MKDIIPAKKQSPILGLTGMGGGVGSNIVAGLAKDTPYVDEVFSTYLYKGTQGSNTANTGLDMTKGGMVWYKSRSASNTQNLLTDTVRGANKVVYSDAISGELNDTGLNQTFTNTGWTLNNGYSDANNGSNTYTSWNFRKRKGFFDVVTYTGNGSNRTIDHNLGSVPGSIWIKQLDGSGEWICYHRGVGAEKFLQLNNIEAENDDATAFQDTAPTASVFSLGTHAYVNGSGNTYVAYVFAGGASDEPGSARSVDFDGTGDRLTLGATSDFDFGTGDFTIEGWWKSDQASNAGNSQGLFGLGNYQSTGGMLLYQYNGYLALKKSNVEKINISTNPFDNLLNQWVHVAVVKSGSTVTLYLNGDSLASYTDSGSYGDSPQNTMSIGGSDSGHVWYGWISNFRVVKGTAVYTDTFKPSTAGLTAITNTKLLCCNKNTVTGSTVTPGTISASGDPTASTDTPFDDPAGLKFGEDEDQSIIKCGVYGGNSSTDGPDIYIGWEPQWILFKVISKTDPWYIADTMRRISTDGVDNSLLPNSTQAENDGNWELLDVSSTGWKPTTADSKINGSGHRYIYIAMRRPDPLVAKPPEAATDVFTMVYGNSAGTNPSFVSNFVVDYCLNRTPTTNESWYSTSRLTSAMYMATNTTAAEGPDGGFRFDYRNGFRTGGAVPGYECWMWKRHAGFDVVCYKGDGIYGHQVRHSMNKIPEMMWVKNREDSGEEWFVYHKGLDGGNQPETHWLYLQTADGEMDSNAAWNDTAPTSTYFTLGGGNAVNKNNKENMAMLFASVDGISKCDSYTGNGQTLSNGTYVTTGFQPRYIILKRSDGSGNWFVFDSLRGFGTPGQNTLSIYLNDGNTSNGSTYVEPDATGFRVVDDSPQVNGNGYKYIYYAHA